MRTKISWKFENSISNTENMLFSMKLIQFRLTCLSIYRSAYTPLMGIYNDLTISIVYCN